MGEHIEVGDNSEVTDEPITILSRSASGKIYSDTGLWNTITEGWLFISQYGWFILLGSVLLVYIWYKLQPRLNSWNERRERLNNERNFDPVKAEQYQDGMMLARERMQQKLNEQTTAYMERKEEREAKDRDEKIKQWEEFKVIGKSKTKPKKETTYPSNYFPLSGGGGGGGYRSSRRQVSGGG